MTYWGIDLSATRVAVAQLGADLPTSRIYDAGPVKREDHEERIGRACRIAGALNDMLKPFSVDRVIAIESPSAVGRGGDMAAGEVFGLCLRVLVSHASGHWFFVHPLTLKCFALGSGKGEKDQIRLAVHKRWSFEAPSNDEVDAYVLAQMARCVVEPAEFTQQQQEVAGRCFATGGKKLARKNRQFTLPLPKLAAALGTIPPDSREDAVAAPSPRRRKPAGVSGAETRTDGLLAREGQTL